MFCFVVECSQLIKGVIQMKRNLKLGTVIILCVLTISVCAFSTVSFSQGSDPLVTLSYLTDIILPQMKTDIMAEIAVNYQPDATVPEDEAAPNVQPEPEQPPVSDEIKEESEQPLPTGTYTLLELEYGKSVFADSVLEFIVRPGSEVKTISPFDAQGIADITNGKEYLNGDTIEHNAYCLVPRGADGRGFTVTNEKSYILVRGEYHIG